MSSLQLSGEMVKQLQEALLSAFPTRSSLDQLIRLHFNRPLDSLVSNLNHSETVFGIIQWAEAKGVIEELIRAARKQNPDNPKLATFANQYLSSVTPINNSPLESFSCVSLLVAIFSLLLVLFIPWFREIRRASINTLSPVEVEINKALENRVPGKKAYDIPEEMTLETMYTVTLLITKDPHADLLKEMQGRGKTSDIPVSPSMKARLVGEKFRIVDLNSEEQVVGEKESSQWQWQVTPLENGEWPLSLVIKNVLPLSNREDKLKDIGPFTTHVMVRVAPFRETKRYLAANWPWMATITVAPFGLWALLKWRRTGKDMPWKIIIPNMMSEKARRIRRMHEALLDAFPSYDDLEQMLRFQLDIPLDQVAKVRGKYSHILFKLIEEADSQGWSDALIKGAHQANPGNAKLSALAEELSAKDRNTQEKM